MRKKTSKKAAPPAAPAEHAPNICFVGAKDGREPFSLINNGSETIVLPEDQSKPFYHAEASTIVRLYGWLYKPVKPK